MIVVTGGAKGIGKAIVEKFASEGHEVITCGRDQKALEQMQELVAMNYSTRLHIFKADLSDKEQVLRFAEFIKTIGVPRVLVNNTGTFIPGQTHNEPEGALEHLMATNVYSAYHLSRALLPNMMAQRKGHIFNMCSIASIVAYTNGGSYCISKFALYGFNKLLREEMKPHGIAVTAILPGATLTDSWAGSDLPPERFMKPEHIAEAIYTAWKVSGHTVIEEIILRPQEGDIP